jgi:hypothetical protein
MAADVPSPMDDHKEDTPDMTLLTLDTECIDKLSVEWFLRLEESLRKDT